MKNRGFTIIEMLVAVTLFTVILGSMVGLFISAVRSQRAILTAQKLSDETAYVMEYMSRFLRMAIKERNCPAGPGCCLTASGNGYNYEISAGGNGIKFINFQGICQKFYLDLNTRQLKEDRGNALWGDLTSDKMEITSLNFYILGAAHPPVDNLQPRATVSMTMRKAGTTHPEIIIQTTVSQRNLEL